MVANMEKTLGNIYETCPLRASFCIIGESGGNPSLMSSLKTGQFLVWARLITNWEEEEPGKELG